MFEDHALVTDLRETLGLELSIDDDGRSVVSDNAGGEIGIFFRRNGAQVHLCAAVQHVDMADSAFPALTLKQHLDAIMSRTTHIKSEISGFRNDISGITTEE